MTHEEQTRLLAVAARVYQSTAPSDFELRVAARRVLTRMQTRPQPTWRRRTPWALAVLCAVGTALAAGTAGFEDRASQPAAAPPAPFEPSSAQRSPTSHRQQATPPEPQALDTRTATSGPPSTAVKPDPEPRVSREQESTRAELPRRARAAKPRAETGSTAAANWREVADAMRQDDHERARRALTSMTREPATRAKAQLGLAQLALGRGDCAEVRRQVSQLATSTAASVETRRRAQRLLERCSSREQR